MRITEATEPGPLRSLVLLFDAQQLRGLIPEEAEFFVIGFVLLHPSGSRIVPFAGLCLVAQPPVSHGQEEPALAVPALPPGRRLLQRLDRLFPVTGAVMGGPQRGPVFSLARC